MVVTINTLVKLLLSPAMQYPDKRQVSLLPDVRVCYVVQSRLRMRNQAVCSITSAQHCSMLVIEHTDTGRCRSSRCWRDLASVFYYGALCNTFCTCTISTFVDCLLRILVSVVPTIADCNKERLRLTQPLTNLRRASIEYHSAVIILKQILDQI